jgi:hypothetical protein
VVLISHEPGLRLRLALAWQLAWIPASASPEARPFFALPAARALASARQSAATLARRPGGWQTISVSTLMASRMKAAIASALASTPSAAARSARASMNLA